MSQDEEWFEEQALTLRSDGHYDEALEILYRLEKTGIHRAAIVGVIGATLYYMKEDITLAMPYLREAVLLSPRSERASLALFHALFESGEIDAAFDEMRRYLKDNESPEYRRLLADMNSE